MLAVGLFPEHALPMLPAFFLGLALGLNSAPRWEVHFSPRGGCVEEVTSEIADARRSIRVQAYGFTSQPIADALIEAASRGVDVRVLLDERANRMDRRSQAARLIEAGVPVAFDGKHPISHDKVVCIDSATVLTGSFNMSMNADRSNSENLLTIRDPWLAAAYRAHWHEHAAHAELAEP